jgi:hypothetical protein
MPLRTVLEPGSHRAGQDVPAMKPILRSKPSAIPIAADVAHAVGVVVCSNTISES